MAFATAPDFGSSDESQPINVDEIMFSMQWPEVPVRQMEHVQWWEQVPKENVTITVMPKHSDVVEQMFPDFCAQNRARQQQVEKKEKASSSSWFGSKKSKDETPLPITTNSMNITAKIKNPQGANDLISAMNSAVFPGPAILTFRLEAHRDYAPARDAECWQLLAAVFRKCYPQFMTIEKIEITGQDIGDDALLFLAAAVGHYPRLHTLDLWENKISGRGAIAFFKVITKNKNVQTLNLGKNVLDMNAKTDLAQLAKEAGVDVDTF